MRALAWFSLISACKGTALKIVQSTESPSAAWLQQYRACGVKEKTRLMREFHSLKVKLREDPIKFTMRVDRVAKELRQVEKVVDEDDKKTGHSEETHERVCHRSVNAGGRVR